jgi:PST family polysaccharide transporter
MEPKAKGLLGRLRFRPGVVMARFGWATINQIGKMVIQFAGVAILSRLVSVSDFGLLAMAQLFTAFAVLIQDMGTSAAIIQRKELTQPLVSTVFWQNVIVGLALMLIVGGISPLAAILLKEPRLQDVLLALTFVFPLGSAATMQQAILQREGRMKDLARIEILTSLIGLGAGVGAALYGWGVYSLVVQQIVAAALRTLQLWVSTTWHPRFEWSKQEFKTTWGFTSHLLAFTSVNYFARNADNMLIGRYLGAHDVAIYSMVYRLVLTPLQAVGSVTSRVLLPIYSQMQDRPAEIGKHFVQTLSLIGLFCGPAMALTWGLRRPFIEVFLGSRWMEVADVLAWLAPVGYIQTLAINIGFVIIALGRTKLLRNIGFVNSGVVVVTFFLTVQFGIIGVAAGYLVVNLLLGIGTMQVTLKTVDQNFFGLLRLIWLPLAASILVGLGAWFADTYLTALGMQALLRLGLIGIAGLAVYALLVIVLARSPLKQAIAFMKTGSKSHEQLDEKGIGVGNVT